MNCDERHIGVGSSLVFKTSRTNIVVSAKGPKGKLVSRCAKTSAVFGIHFPPQADVQLLLNETKSPNIRVVDSKHRFDIGNEDLTFQ